MYLILADSQLSAVVLRSPGGAEPRVGAWRAGSEAGWLTKILSVSRMAMLWFDPRDTMQTIL